MADLNTQPKPCRGLWLIKTLNLNPAEGSLDGADGAHRQEEVLKHHVRVGEGSGVKKVRVRSVFATNIFLCWFVLTEVFFMCHIFEAYEQAKEVHTSVGD